MLSFLLYGSQTLRPTSPPRPQPLSLRSCGVFKLYRGESVHFLAVRTCEPKETESGQETYSGTFVPPHELQL